MKLLFAAILAAVATVAPTGAAVQNHIRGRVPKNNRASRRLTHCPAHDVLACQDVNDQGIVATCGGMEKVAAPVSVVWDREQSCDMIVFAEKLDFTIPAGGVNVDATLPGQYQAELGISGADTVFDADSHVAVPSGLEVAEGTVVNSYLVHADPPLGPIGQVEVVNYQGSVTFEEEIVGVIILRGSLYATDDMLGATGTTYEDITNAPGNIRRGFEGYGEPVLGLDTVTFDTNTVTLDLYAFAPYDQVRVLTHAKS
ncbi:hypothetical protein ACHAXT_009533 [Thalassiosira profunda]